MPYDRLLPTLAIALALTAWAGAQAPDAARNPSAAGQAKAAAKVPRTEAEKAAEAVIDEAIDKLKAVTSVRAQLLETVEMLGQSFAIQGTYLRAPSNRFRMNLSVVRLGDAKGTMIQVCDGKYLIEFQQVLEVQACERTDISQVLGKLNDSHFDPEIREQLQAQLGLAGPDALLRGLRKLIRFDQKKSDVLDNHDVWVLRGEWSDPSTLNLPGVGALPAKGPLPPFVPSRVTLWLGKGDGWPYQVEFKGMTRSILETAPPEKKAAGTPALPPVAASDRPTRIVLSYTGVEFGLTDKDIGRDEFKFQPPQGVQIFDRTAQDVARIEGILRALDDRKKAEAAQGKGAEPGPGGELPSVDVPKSATPPR
ncbi:MAG TPA: hypothetical protein VG406_24335 [Isosphaeraceae bacterium]|jgi:hypothetical protein|nr:hypothetical protein [Isosphaeraceae bacterium]